MAKYSGFFESLTKSILGNLTREWKWIARERGVVFAKAVTHSIRIILLLHYVILILCFLAALSLFSAVILAASQYQENHTLHLTLPLTISLLLFGITSLVLSLSVCQKTWYRMLRIEHWVDSILGIGSSSTPAPSGMDREDVEQIVNEILARKQSSKTNPQDPT
jgi:hypothetical protein